MNALRAHPRDGLARLATATPGGRPMRLHHVPTAVLIACSLCVPGAAFAASAASCSVDTSAAQIAFGTYDPLSTTPLDGIGTLKLTCDKNNVPATFALDKGGSSTFVRKMMSGGNALPYNLYVGSPNSNIIFGDGTSGTQTVGATTTPAGGGTFTAQAQVFGRIQTGENPAFGSYSDTIHVLVTF